MAIACLRLCTFPPLPPLPERSVPFFFRRIALSTLLPAAFPYFRPPLLFFFAAIISFRMHRAGRKARRAFNLGLRCRTMAACCHPFQCEAAPWERLAFQGVEVMTMGMKTSAAVVTGTGAVSFAQA